MTVLKIRIVAFWDMVVVLFGAKAPVGQDLIIHEVSRSHTTMQHSR